jgi:hypothetical protein
MQKRHRSNQLDQQDVINRGPERPHHTQRKETKQMNINLFVKTYILGNEDARAFQDDGLFELAEKRGYKIGTDEFDWFVGGGAAFRFNGDTFETKADDITV